jgi:HAE1 family hydrophobic/amphiphilic exporter-1
MLTTIGSGNDPVTLGNVFVKLVKKQQRAKGLEQILAELRADLKDIPGANISYRTQAGVGGNMKPVIMSVRGDNLEVLQNLSAQVERIFRSTPGAVDIENSLEMS